jgi:hypothetical protein
MAQLWAYPDLFFLRTRKAIEPCFLSKNVYQSFVGTKFDAFIETTYFKGRTSTTHAIRSMVENFVVIFWVCRFI